MLSIPLEDLLLIYKKQKTTKQKTPFSTREILKAQNKNRDFWVAF